MKWTSDDTIPPEYVRAVEGLAKAIKTGEIHNIPFISNFVLEQGTYTKILRQFETKDIPSGDFWRWNQAKSRKQIKFPNSTITFFKLTPRKRRAYPANTPSPCCKLWQFYVTEQNQSKNFQALWCEKAPDSEVSLPRRVRHNTSFQILPPYTSEIYFPQPATRTETEFDVSLEDLSFLAPFMDFNIATQFWPLNDPNNWL